MSGAPEPGTCVLLDPSSSALAALPGAVRTRSVEELRTVLDREPALRTVVLGPDLELDVVADLLAGLRTGRPGTAVVLERRHIRPDVRRALVEAGLREVVTVGDLGGLARAVDAGPGPGTSAAPSAPAGPPARRGRVTTVFSAKGGTGKTTVATNLAAALADGGRRDVVLVDLDVGRGDVAMTLDLPPSATLADVVATGTEQLRGDRLEQLLTPHSPGLRALLAPGPRATPLTVPAPLVGRVLDLLAARVDHVVVDTPPSLDAQALAAVDRSDTVVLLSTLDIAALRHLTFTLGTLRALGSPPGRWRAVLNRADAQVGLAVGEVERTLGLPLSALLPSSRAVPTSVNLGVPLVLQQPQHPFSFALRAFAVRELVPDRELVLDLRRGRDDQVEEEVHEGPLFPVPGAAPRRSHRSGLTERRDAAGRPATH